MIQAMLIPDLLPETGTRCRPTSSSICCNEVYASLILVILLTTMLPPFLMRWIYRKWPHYYDEKNPDTGSTGRT